MNFRVFNPESQAHTSHRQTARSRAMQRVRKNRLAAGGETTGAEPAKRLTMADIRKTAHRTISPVRSLAKTQVFSSPPPDVTAPVSADLTAVGTVPSVDPRILELSAQVTAQTVRLTVPVHQRDDFGRLPLRAWYDCRLYGPAAQRLKDIEAKRTQHGTMEKDLSALSVWERFTRPAEWVGEWPGISLSAINAEYLRGWVSNALHGGLSKGYLEGLANHLNWILGIAVDRDVISKAPKKPPVKQIAATITSTLFDDDDLTTIFEVNGNILETLDAIHAQLDGQTELQTAFVLACSTGLRPRDLFGLCWSDLTTISGTPAIIKKPKKTERHGTTVRIPLAPCIAARMAALRCRAGQDGKVDHEGTGSREQVAESARIFPSLVSATAKDPEKSHAARRRNAAVREAAIRAGFDFPPKRDKPWQIARATCNERLERHCPGIGEFVLGHSAGSINKKHYRQRWSEAVKAIATLPQPVSFVTPSEKEFVDVGSFTEEE